jgi:hypothetical protein
MKDKIIEILAWAVIIMIAGCIVWWNYEISIPY